jgi:hypothetical protein
VENLRIEAAEREEQKNGKKSVGIVIKVGVGTRLQAVMLQDFEANDAGNNFTRNIEVEKKIATNRSDTERAHQYDHFKECAQEPNCVL